MQDDIRFSRLVATAERLGEHADDRHRFLEKRILVTGEREVLATKNGRACLLFGLRLLLRICPNIVVSLPKECAILLDECHTAIDPLTFGGGIYTLRDVTFQEPEIEEVIRRIYENGLLL